MVFSSSLRLLPGKKVFAVLLGGLLTACASVAPPPPAELPVELPAAFMAAGTLPSGTTEQYWWYGFDDAQLNRFVDSALQQNSALAQAIARARMAESQIRIARADQLPQIGLGFSSARQRQNLSGLPQVPGSPDSISMLSNNHELALDISWELDLWGRLSALSASARADYLASTEQLRATRQSVIAQVVRMYFEIVHAQSQVKLSERTVESLEEMARQINNRVAAGITSPADGMLADANLQSAQAGLEQRREALERSLRQLQVLAGEYPSGSLDRAAQLPSAPALPAAGVPAELLARRPDVRAAEAALISAGYQLGAAQRSFLPSLSLNGSAGFSAAELPGLLSSSNLVWAIAGRIVQPVFQGGRLVAQTDLVEGQRDEALHNYAETALNALAEVETALAVDALLRSRERALDTSADAAEQALTVSFNRYLQGIDPFLNVLESQQRALDGRSAYISARHARLENHVSLQLALGGGFEADSLPEPDPAQGSE